MEDAKKNFFGSLERAWVVKGDRSPSPARLPPHIDRLFTALLAIEIFFLCNSTWHIGRAVRAGLKRCVFELNTFLTCLISSLWKTKKNPCEGHSKQQQSASVTGGWGSGFPTAPSTNARAISSKWISACNFFWWRHGTFDISLERAFSCMTEESWQRRRVEGEARPQIATLETSYDVRASSSRWGWRYLRSRLAVSGPTSLFHFCRCAKTIAGETSRNAVERKRDPPNCPSLIRYEVARWDSESRPRELHAIESFCRSRRWEAFLKASLLPPCRNVSGADHNSSLFWSFAITHPFAFKIADLLTLLLTLDNRSDFFFSTPCRHITPHFFHFQASPRSACVGQIVFERALERHLAAMIMDISRMCITPEWPSRPTHTPKVSCKTKTCAMQQKAVSKRFVLHVSWVLTHLDGFFVRWRADRFSAAIRRGIQEATSNSRVASDLRSALRCRLASATKARVIIPDSTLVAASATPNSMERRFPYCNIDPSPTLPPCSTSFIWNAHKEARINRFKDRNNLIKAAVGWIT